MSVEDVTLLDMVAEKKVDCLALKGGDLDKENWGRIVCEKIFEEWEKIIFKWNNDRVLRLI